MSHYQARMDEDVWRYVERVNACYPSGEGHYIIDEQRGFYNKMCASFHAGRPDRIKVETRSLQLAGRSIAARTYLVDEHRKSSALIIYFHGGGFVVGNLDSHDDICAELADQAGCDLIAIDYRLAPEHAHPAQSQDALDSFRLLADGAYKTHILCGDSAGATLCGAVSHLTRLDRVRPDGQVLIYPALGNDYNSPSRIEHSNAPILSASDMKAYDGMRSNGRDIINDAGYYPLMDKDYSNLPPTVMISAELDPLTGDCGTYRDAIIADGRKAEWIEEAGLVHGYLRARHMAKRAEDSFQNIVTALKELGNGNWPFGT